MILLLLRHGKAEDHVSSVQNDFLRPLTDKGLEQARQAARILGAADLLPDLVLSSPLVRARQTADAFTLAAKIPGPVIQAWLASGMDPQTALSELAAFPEFERVMIVGHEPDFSRLIQYTLGISGAAIEVRKGSVTCLEIVPPARQAVLRFLIPHKLAKHME
ncbi:MAG: histidine phosphatase family protein [Armatimonadetes bacterium]|nr:histidine phosphatase family protein [Akkermansiaceae bacterium]